MYRKEYFSRMLMNGMVRDGVSIIAGNGKEICECNTDMMASKIIKGLELLSEEEKRKSNFKL